MLFIRLKGDSMLVHENYINFNIPNRNTALDWLLNVNLVMKLTIPMM